MKLITEIIKIIGLSFFVMALFIIFSGVLNFISEGIIDMLFEGNAKKTIVAFFALGGIFLFVSEMLSGTLKKKIGE